MDTRFSMAIQLLILIAESSEPVSSGQMAQSVGTNPSHVRRLLGQLKKSGLIDSHQGALGFELLLEPADIDLFRIFCAVSGADSYHAFDLHQNPSDACLVGRHIRPVLSEMFADMEQAMQAALLERTLADCIDAVRARVKADVPDTT